MARGTLTQLVEESETWGPVEWWRFELRSFAAAPGVQQQIGMLGPKGTHREFMRASTLGCLNTLANMAAIVLPVLGAAMSVQWLARGATWDNPLQLVGIFSVIALLLALVGYGYELKRPRAVAMTAHMQITLVHIVPGLVSLFILGTRTEGLWQTGVDGFTGASVWWLLPIALDVLFHVFVLVRGNKPKGGPQNPLENVRWSIQEVDPELISTIVRERDIAIARLAQRQLIDENTAARARALPAGMLAWEMAPEVRSAYFTQDPA